MDRLLPRDAPEAALPQEGGTSVLRGTAYTVLAVMLVAGAWVRFNGQIAAIAPALAGPASEIADQLGVSGQPRGLLALDMLPVGAPGEAVASMGLNQADTASLTEALRRQRLRLVHLPVLDVSPVLAAGETGHSVEVSAGGYTRVVRLTRQPVTLTLPIAAAGTVTFRSEGPDAVSIGALTLAGPIRLPVLQSGQNLHVGVLAQ
jgi:hypothetical protein